MIASTPAHIRLAWIGPHVVALDLRNDSYACLLDGGELMCPEGEGRFRVQSDEVFEALEEAGLAVRTAPPQPPAPDIPRDALRSEGPTSLADTLDFLHVGYRRSRLYHRLAFADLIALAGAERPRQGGRGLSLEACLAAFRQGLPWLPAQGVCLYRAFILLAWLRAQGHDALWVFGVRLSPFSAHCWLQTEKAVLGDDPERVSAYTPILVV